jgi:hypothetical protein
LSDPRPAERFAHPTTSTMAWITVLAVITPITG